MRKDDSTTQCSISRPVIHFFHNVYYRHHQRHLWVDFRCAVQRWADLIKRVCNSDNKAADWSLACAGFYVEGFVVRPKDALPSADSTLPRREVEAYGRFGDDIRDDGVFNPEQCHRKLSIRRHMDSGDPEWPWFHPANAVIRYDKSQTDLFNGVFRNLKRGCLGLYSRCTYVQKCWKFSTVFSD